MPEWIDKNGNIDTNNADALLSLSAALNNIMIDDVNDFHPYHVRIIMEVKHILEMRALKKKGIIK